MKREYQLSQGSEQRKVFIEKCKDDRFTVEQEEEQLTAEALFIKEGLLQIKREDGSLLEIPYTREGSKVQLLFKGFPLEYDVMDASRAAILGGSEMSGGGDGVLCVPMPGQVIAIHVAEGDQVQANQSIIVVEAMKMENELKAPIDGIVESIQVEVGQTVKANDVLLKIQAEDA